MSIYRNIICEKNYSKNRCDWSGNNRFIGLDKGDEIEFLCAPVNRECGIKTEGENILKRLLFTLKPAIKDLKRQKGADFVKLCGLKITYPYGIYGTLIEGKTDFAVYSPIKSGVIHGGDGKSDWLICDGRATLVLGKYTVVLKTDGILSKTENGVTVGGASKTAVSFCNNTDIATKNCEKLFNNSKSITEQSKNFWEEYFNSCKVVDGENEYVIRQYWHWWVALINVSEIEFNDFPLYMAPDRPNWLGTWSNDGPESIMSLCLTNKASLSKRLLKSYIDAAISDEGIHSWYLNADGVGCFGRKGDLGCLSHGVPNIVHSLWFYIFNTKDFGILDESLSNMTVYEKIKLYMYKLFELRDLDSDGLIEWRNLWETGWDDKLGCFFKGANLGDWCKMAVEFNEDEKAEFYRQNSYPVIAVAEQYYTRLALISLLNMAKHKNDDKTVDFCKEKLKLCKDSFYKKCIGTDGFYHDFNIRENKIIDGKSADCYYALFFEEEKQRTDNILSFLEDEKVFKAAAMPMQSLDTEGFSPTGYWSGGHWPREMSYVALGIANSGNREIAEKILKKAIMSGEGDNLYEVLNPLTALPSSSVTKMAYDVLEVVAMLCINGKIDWI